jgi:hypothetical protein
LHNPGQGVLPEEIIWYGDITMIGVTWWALYDVETIWYGDKERFIMLLVIKMNIFHEPSITYTKLSVSSN